MPIAGGTCKDCGAPTAKFTSLRCRDCNMATRRGKGNWPKKTRHLKEKKCPVCGNLNHLNFSQEKIWNLKETANLYRQQHDFYLKNLDVVRKEHRRWEKKVEKAKQFHDRILIQTNKRLIQLGKTAKGLEKQLKEPSH